MFSCGLWESKFSKIFEDGCPISRSADLFRSKEKSRKFENKVLKRSAFVSKNPFQIPGQPHMGVFNKISQIWDFKYENNSISSGNSTEMMKMLSNNKKQKMMENRFADRIKYVATESGEINNIFTRKEKNTIIDGSTKFDGTIERINVSRYITSEVRTREFVTRQLTGLGSQPQKAQATFMMMIAMHLAPVVAGDDWKDVGPNLCSEMGWSMTQFAKILLISAPRRFGKTRTVSMMVINYALSVPGTIIMVYSTSQDTSNLLRKDVEQCLSDAGEMEFAGKRVKLTDLKGKYGERQLHLFSPYKPGVSSVIYFCPGITKQNQDRYFYIIFIFLFLFFHFPQKRGQKRFVYTHFFIFSLV